MHPVRWDPPLEFCSTSLFAGQTLCSVSPCSALLAVNEEFKSLVGTGHSAHPHLPIAIHLCCDLHGWGG